MRVLLLILLASSALGQSLTVEQSTNGVTIRLPEDQQVWIIKAKTNIEAHLPPGQFKHHHRLHLYTLRAHPAKAKQVIDKLRDDGLLEFAEPDFRVSVDAGPVIPNDSYWSNQWDMLKISMPVAWSVATANPTPVVVAVIDTGIDFGHPDLIPNLYTDPVTGGHGWQCYGGVLKEGGNDVFGHGTHCAGTVAAKVNNALGIAGMNMGGVQLLSMAFLDSTGSGQFSDAIELFDKLVDLKTNGLPVYITSNSYGGLGTPSDAITAAFAELEANGILSACAAGNNGLNIDLTPFTPACATNRGIITVAATDQNDSLAYFSNYGLIGCDIAAPGFQTWSTLPTNPSIHLNSPSGYGPLSGTSMATPHVAGLAALVKANHLTFTVYQLKDAILNHASYVPMTNNLKDSFTTTGGRIDAYKTLVNPYLQNPIPNRPPVVTVSPTPGSIVQGGNLSLSFTATDPDSDQLRYVIWDTTSTIPYTATNSLVWPVPHWYVNNVISAFEGALDGNGGSSFAQVNVNLLKDPAYTPNFYAITNWVELAPSNTGPPSYLPLGMSQTRLTTNSNPLMSFKVYSTWNSKGAINANWWGPVGYPYAVPLTPTNGPVVHTVWCQNTELRGMESQRYFFHTGTDQTPQSVFPRLTVTLSATEGTVPFTVNYDASGSYFPNGFASTNGLTYYFYYFPDPAGSVNTYRIPVKGSFVVTEPGVHMWQFLYYDWLTQYPDAQMFQIVGLASNGPPPVVTKPRPPTTTTVKLLPL